ncbi:unnamed protein product [Echinostoma caproni]|uniref:MCM AAA-lid domain-containing protein n=1 Tax=Echinostoma caproni TaxID=27848 RepID=A0A3P8IXE1_9TREM|nr:unnamed protein product [Echinostoma caproni]
MSDAAASALRDFYLELRRNRHSRDTFPVTMRQLESLIRLTEARARAELREEATRQDALDACELMRATGLGTGYVGETPANATLSQIARTIPQTSRRLTSNSGPAAARRLLSALESCWSVSENTKSKDFRKKRFKKQKGEYLAAKDPPPEILKEIQNEEEDALKSKPDENLNTLTQDELLNKRQS